MTVNTSGKVIFTAANQNTSGYTVTAGTLTFSAAANGAANSLYHG